MALCEKKEMMQLVRSEWLENTSESVEKEIKTRVKILHPPLLHLE
jgi:hypothetical protein